MIRTVRVAVILALVLGFAVSTALAQAARTARLTITVMDQTNAVIPGATVTVVARPGQTTPAPVSATTSPVGVAQIADLAVGRYDIRAEFAGFEPTLLENVPLRPGDNRQTIVLRIEKVEQDVVVGQDPAEAASDRRGASFGSALTREQIDALSDDPAEMKRQLEEIAGPGAVIRVDSFEGAALPPKAMIKSIRVTRDAFAAENHNAGAFGIDIVTQPGLGVLRGGVQTRLRPGAMSGRSPFTASKGAENTQDYGIGFGGPIVRERSSFNLFMNGVTSYDSSNLNVALPGATRSEALSHRTRRDRFSLSSNFDYAVTLDQTLRISYNPILMKNTNLGIGAYDLPERAYRTEDRSHNLRIQEIGPLGRRFFINTRLGLTWLRNESQSAVEAPTIRVNDAFVSGGQQMAGGRRQTSGNLSSDLDYVRGIHSIRTGLSVDFGSYSSDSTTNYLGTYTFASLADYEAGRPASYTRRVGDPNVSYRTLQSAVYIQDDIRVRRNLTLSPGVRYEVQSHVDSLGNVGPRFGVTWAPSQGGRTTLRGSFGVFYDWLNTNTLEQAVRVDGFHQQELNILSPAFPDPGQLARLPPVSRYLLGDDLALARNTRVSAGVDQTVGPRMRVGVLYSHIRGTQLARGLNLNAPVDGIRPDPGAGNIIEVVSDGAMRQHNFTASMNAGSPPPPPFGGARGPRWDWGRASINASYTLLSIRNNTEGDFATSPTGNLADDWGPTQGDIRHRFNVGVISQTFRNLNVLMFVTGMSGTPYTIRTGRDDNGDALFNDRPAGVSRNSERGAAQWTLNANIAYGFAFGQPSPQAGPAGIGVLVQGTPGGTAPTVTTFTPEPARFRLMLFANAQNLLNRHNYGGYSGTLTSPFFGQPTMVANPRKIDVGIGFQF
jgi:hypothetical protein